MKYNKSAEEALAQIHAKHYERILKDIASEFLLVGINYSKTPFSEKYSHCLSGKFW